MILKIIEGKTFQPGLRELVVGKGAVRQFEGFKVGGTVKLGIVAPRSVPIYREELWAAVRDENRAAAEAPATLPSLPRRG